jgi:hypothetical protein
MAVKCDDYQMEGRLFTVCDDGTSYVTPSGSTDTNTHESSGPAGEMDSDLSDLELQRGLGVAPANGTDAEHGGGEGGGDLTDFFGSVANFFSNLFGGDGDNEKDGAGGGTGGQTGTQSPTTGGEGDNICGGGGHSGGDQDQSNNNQSGNSNQSGGNSSGSGTDGNGDHSGTDNNGSDGKTTDTTSATTGSTPTPDGGPSTPTSTPNPDGDGNDGSEGNHHSTSVAMPGGNIGSLSTQLTAVGNSQDGSSDGSHGPRDPGDEMPNPEGGGNSPTSNVAHGSSFWDQVAGGAQGGQAGLHLSSAASVITDENHAALEAAGTTSVHDVSTTALDTGEHAAPHDVALTGAALHGELGTATLHDALTLSGGSFATQMHV